MDTKPTSKQTSRKGKKAWRKNVDVADINEGLENLRTEIRAGGVIAEKPDEALFAVDTVGSASIQKKILSRQRIQKPLRADEILSQRSAVPALESRKRGAASDSIIGDGIVRESSRAAKKRKGDGISFKELQRLRRIAYGEGVEGQDLALKGSEGVAGKELYDAWGNGDDDNDDAMAVAAVDDDKKDEGKKEEEEKYSFLEKKKPKVAPVTLKHKPIALTASKAPIPAVRLPDPGISYNPEFEKWDQLLTKEGDKEVEAEKKRLAEKAYEEHILQKALEEESSEGDSSESEEEDDDEEGEGTEKKEQFVKKRPERKTQAQRNKIKRRKEAERELKRLEHIRKQKEQLQAIKKLARAVEEKERLKLQQLATTGEVDDPDADIETLRKKRFGKRHIPQAPLELKLPDELTESLRLLKPEGNLVRDRYRSFLERGILETRVPVSHRKKAKTYMSEKWSYKDWTW